MTMTTTAIFLFIGLDSERKTSPSKAFPEMAEGFREIPQLCETMAEALEAWFDEDQKLGVHVGFPGVFDYEITEQMGCWLFHNSEAGKAEFTAELVRLVAQWRF